MKYIIRTILRIVLLMLLFVIPIGFFMTALVLTGRDIPLSNIGIRNFLTVSKNLLIPIVLASYLFSTGLAVALTDKIKVRSVFLLHIPPLFVGAAIGAFFFFSGLPITAKSATRGLVLGYSTFLKPGVFNEADGSMILPESEEKGRSLILIYNKTTNALLPLDTGPLAEHIRADATRGFLSISYKQKTARYSGRFPFGAFVRETPLTSGRFVRFYTAQVRSLLLMIRGRYTSLAGTERAVYGFFLSLSVFLLLIPLVYAMNDRGWSFFGIIGLFTVLFVLPLFYRALFRIRDVFGTYSFLTPAIAAAGCGIIIDILIAIRERKKSPFS
ncbi:MAG: hypothetical protein JXQ30_11015 [Spirochaetes bacterium]|nr:hypothetical protein [Spirochaetota bacterium]